MNFDWMKEPKALNPELYEISRGTNKFDNIDAIYEFKSSQNRYWLLRFSKGEARSYPYNELKIVKSCLDDAKAKSCFEYLSRIAELISIKSEDGTKLLSKQYEKINFIGDNAALAPYLNPDRYKLCTYATPRLIFPFGCNASQYCAVKTAFENQMSVIQGPPGTGKTQTILNIIANILLHGKSVIVVSNNNSATANVFEKLASNKYGLDFIAAQLGNSNNKEVFINNQTGKYSDISSWNRENECIEEMLSSVQNTSQELNEIFGKQERLAQAKQERTAISTEYEHFRVYFAETGISQERLKSRKRLSSGRLMKLWQECQRISDNNRAITLCFKIRSVILYGISDWKFYDGDISHIVAAMQKLYYEAILNELDNEINKIEHDLKSVDAKEKIENYCNLSMDILKNVLHKKYGRQRERKIFETDDLWKNPVEVQKEYPVILSTTYSVRSSLGKNAHYDYIIMDEASQVDVATGALALSSATNAIIVGDSKQLPNVVTSDIRKRADAIFGSFKINQGYSFSSNSFLKSVCDILPEIKQTLLREHYRCHPKIIEFCNQKFYNGELIIMTEDNGEDDILSVIKTPEGNHERDHFSQRQIVIVKDEVLPKLDRFQHEEIGVIAPYNNQVDCLKSEIGINDIDISTVHKFQGREKDVIIITTVDDEASDFSDDSFLINVAVSRAKKKLCLVTSGNEQPVDSNIADLISYIEYNNFEVANSKIYSVFDYLYKQYTEQRIEYLKRHPKVSEYDSENLMYSMIVDVIDSEEFKNLDVICHQPLNMIVRDESLLDDREREYANHPSTHLDFLIFNHVSKKPVLAVEVDGFHYHKQGTAQAERDKLKNHILDVYGIPYVRFSTNGSGEHEKLIELLSK